MMAELLMPALSPTMEQGTLSRWLVEPGAAVKAGDLLAEIETDKATVELEASRDGTIGKLLVAEGAEDVPVGTPIALIDDGSRKSEPNLAPAAEIREHRRPESFTSSQWQETESRGMMHASPLARKVAQALGHDLASTIPSGSGDRVMVADLIAIGQASCSVSTSASAVSARGAKMPRTSNPDADLSSKRPSAHRRVGEMQGDALPLCLSANIKVDALLDLQAQLNGTLERNGIVISIDDLFLKALALVLLRVPEAKALLVRNGADVADRIDIAVAIENGGRVAPVLDDVARRSLSSISAQVRNLGAQASDGSRLPEAYQGSAAVFSNPGALGIDAVCPIIEPPQFMAFAIGAIEDRPIMRHGQAIGAKMLTAAASFDRRLIDGATAARVLAELRAVIEQPILLLS